MTLQVWKLASARNKGRMRLWAEGTSCAAGPPLIVTYRQLCARPVVSAHSTNATSAMFAAAVLPVQATLPWTTTQNVSSLPGFAKPTGIKLAEQHCDSCAELRMTSTQPTITERAGTSRSVCSCPMVCPPPSVGVAGHPRAPMCPMHPAAAVMLLPLLLLLCISLSATRGCCFCRHCH